MGVVLAFVATSVVFPRRWSMEGGQGGELGQVALIQLISILEKRTREQREREGVRGLRHLQAGKCRHWSHHKLKQHKSKAPARSNAKKKKKQNKILHVTKSHIQWLPHAKAQSQKMPY